MDISLNNILPLEFYLHSDVVTIARNLIGKYLVTNVEGVVAAGKIVETEAYSGRGDKACRAHIGKTSRTKIMYEEGGKAYVYLCYGIHHLFNIVTNKEGLADAVLVRAIQPMLEIEVMKKRRSVKSEKNLASGPGKLSQALGITTKDYGTDLTGNRIWIADSNEVPEIETDRRVGVDYAGEDAYLPWRFYEKNSNWISKKKQKDVIIN